MNRVKYMRTKEDRIIVFSELFDHSDFKSFDPISAGFISFGATGKYEPNCACYGESITLRLKANPDIDTELAKRQILKILE